MARKRKTSLLEDLIWVAALLPWWACLILAAAAYFAFHALAGVKPDTSNLASAISSGLWTAIANVAEYVAPLVFLIAAAVSAWRLLQRRLSENSRPPDPTHSAMPEPAGEPSSAEPEPSNDLYETWKEVPEPTWGRPRIDTSRWSLELLRALEWKRLEVLCARYFESLGFTSKVAREGADGGVDIHLFGAGADTPGILVQCKAWKSYKVGVKPVRELLGVMAAHRVAEGVFVTAGDYTAEARQFAKGNNIHLIDGDDLLAKIGATSAETQHALLETASEGDFTRPTCASCGTKMVERVAQKSGERFWGCRNFPRFRMTLRLTIG